MRDNPGVQKGTYLFVAPFTGVFRGLSIEYLLDHSLSLIYWLFRRSRC